MVELGSGVVELEDRVPGRVTGLRKSKRAAPEVISSKGILATAILSKDVVVPFSKV
jgi:hypothetical protein